MTKNNCRNKKLPTLKIPGDDGQTYPCGKRTMFK